MTEPPTNHHQKPAEQFRIFGRVVTRHHLITALFLLLAIQASLVRIIIPFQVNPLSWLITDPLRHWEHATLSPAFAPMRAIDPVMYQLFLAAIVRVTEDGAIRLALYSGLLSAITPWLWYFWFRELLAARPYLALCGLLLIAWLPSWIGIFSYFMTETLLLPLLGFSFWLTWKAIRTGNFGAYALASTGWLLACMTRVVALPSAFFSVIWMLRDGKERRARLILLAVLSLILLVPAAWRSYVMIGIASPFGIPSINSIYLLSGKKSVEITFLKDHGQRKDCRFFESPSFLIDTFAPLAHWKTWREGTLHLTIDLDKGASHDLAAALKDNLPDAPELMRILLETDAYTWFQPSWPDETRRDFWIFDPALIRWVWAPLALVVVTINIWLACRERRIELLPLLVTVTIVLITFFPSAVGEGRYRKPVEGLLIANALFLIARFKPAGPLAPDDANPV